MLPPSASMCLALVFVAPPACLPACLLAIGCAAAIIVAAMPLPLPLFSTAAAGGLWRGWRGGHCQQHSQWRRPQPHGRGTACVGSVWLLRHPILHRCRV